MNSSVKFLAPSVTGGLPFPGWPLGGFAPESDFLSSEPHAEIAMASATVSRASIALYHVRDVISVLPLLWFLRRLERCALGLVSPPSAQRTRRRVALEECEKPVRRESEHRDQKR